MKVIKLLSLVFSTIGLGLLLGSMFLYAKTAGFMDRAATVEGKVIDLVRHRSSAGSGGTYRPVVEFTSPTGQRVEFTSSVGSNPPSYRVGELVTVLYDPTDPHKARIKSFSRSGSGSSSSWCSA